MIIPFFSREIDERFLMHRLKSTSLAGVIGGLVCVGLWAYHYYGHGEFRWDLFAVVATMAAVKVATMVYYRTTD
jgi:hypothetical protein